MYCWFRSSVMLAYFGIEDLTRESVIITRIEHLLFINGNVIDECGDNF